MQRKISSPPPRTTFRHGDLRRALLEAGIELARAGGPDAVVLREATRRAGVVPNAAYRHFVSREQLLQAVRSAALSALAVAIETELAGIRKSKDPAEIARAKLRAVGIGYLRFAQTETGLFRTAFSVSERVEEDTNPANVGESGLNPFQLLSAALDEMVQAGILPSERRRNAEYLAWSAVHGLAFLVIDGPLRGRDPKELQSIGQRVVEMVEKGL